MVKFIIFNSRKPTKLSHRLSSTAIETECLATGYIDTEPSASLRQAVACIFPIHHGVFMQRASNIFTSVAVFGLFFLFGSPSPFAATADNPIFSPPPAVDPSHLPYLT